jgi:protein CpxP
MSFKHGKVLNGLALILGLVMVAGLGIVAVGARQGPPPGRGPGGAGGRGMGMAGPLGGQRGLMGGPMGGMMLPGLGQLNLTDAQKEQVRTAVQSHRDAFKAIADRAIAAREALGDAVTADTFDESAIRAKAGEVAAVELDVALLRAKVYAEVFALLTPEQQAKAKQLRAEGKGRIK